MQMSECIFHENFRVCPDLFFLYFRNLFFVFPCDILQKRKKSEKSSRKETFMMKKIWIFALLSAVCILNGCVSPDSQCPPDVMDQARNLVVKGKAECVLIRDNKIAYQQKGRGVSPLLALYKAKRPLMKDAVVVDKVIGRAAAAIAICGKVRHVHGEVMSEDAAEFLLQHNITSSSTLTVKRILNRKRSGLCPLEQSVQGITDPRKALFALEKKIRSMQKNARKNAAKRK